MKKIITLLTVSVYLLILAVSAGARFDGEQIHPGFVNSVGMDMVRIEAGSFMMGQNQGEESDWDENPVRKVTISKQFFISSCEVTNAQYELFDPDHINSRGKRGLSIEPDEAVIFVSWFNAVNYCKWLSEKDFHI